jgi:hypothetical protein
MINGMKLPPIPKNQHLIRQIPPHLHPIITIPISISIRTLFPIPTLSSIFIITPRGNNNLCSQRAIRPGYMENLAPGPLVTIAARPRKRQSAATTAPAPAPVAVAVGIGPVVTAVVLTEIGKCRSGADREPLAPGWAAGGSSEGIPAHFLFLFSFWVSDSCSFPFLSSERVGFLVECGTPKSGDCVISLILAREMSCDTSPRLPPLSGRPDEDKAASRPGIGEEGKR